MREERLFVGLIVADVHSPWAVWVDCDADLGRTQLAVRLATPYRLGTLDIWGLPSSGHSGRGRFVAQFC
jgi:hypothetical protein